VRKLLRRSSFASKTELRAKIEQFIAYFTEQWPSPSAGPTLENL